MDILYGYVLLLVLSSGISFIATFFSLTVNDWLRKNKFTSFNPEHIVGNHMLGVRNEVEAVKDGRTILFLFGWLGALGFLVLWTLPAITIFAHHSLAFAICLYGVCAYAVICCVLYPAMHYGFFGSKFSKYTWLMTAALVAIYGIIFFLLVSVFT